MQCRNLLHSALIGCAAITLIAPLVRATCSDAPSNENVLWYASTNLTGCPAGETTGVASHASRVRIAIDYSDMDCNYNAGVPPESIYVTWQNRSGNVTVNDKTTNTYADDSTDASGHTNVTLPSLSGNGTIRVWVTVSGADQGFQDVVIRTLDTDANGRITASDTTSATDVNWSGSVTSTDKNMILAHVDHWRRNALHGTLVRRTSLCDTCPDHHPNTKGEGALSWSPSQRYIAYTAFVGYASDTACKVFVVPSAPTDGNLMRQITNAPTTGHDYDPSWSPLNGVIVFDRADTMLISKGLFGNFGSVDTTDHIISHSNKTGCNDGGDNWPAVSPDGQWVVFSRCKGYAPPTLPGGWALWKVPIAGGLPTVLTDTTTSSTDKYAQWSANGQTIVFQRNDPGLGNQWRLFKVAATGGSTTQIFVGPTSYADSVLRDAVQPSYSPDDSILTFEYGNRHPSLGSQFTHTLNPLLSSPDSTKIIPNYASFLLRGEEAVMTPRLSADGTRLALNTSQIWAGRRNMNLPPAFTSITGTPTGTLTVSDTASVVSSDWDTYDTKTEYVVNASDPESNTITYNAFFRPAWMNWDAGTRTLSGTPGSGNIGKVYYVKLLATTASGGSDSFIFKITVATTGPMMIDRGALAPTLQVISDNPTQGPLLVRFAAPPNMVTRLIVFDVAGRRVASLEGKGISTLRWDGRARGSKRIGPGIYMYRAEVANVRKSGKVVIVR